MGGTRDIIQEQRVVLAEQLGGVREALRADPDFTFVDAGAILAESCLIGAVHVAGEARESAAALGKEIALRGVEAARDGLGLLAVKRYASTERQDSLGFLVIALTFNATQEYLDKKGRNGDER
jgi:hypothetical protein